MNDLSADCGCNVVYSHLLVRQEAAAVDDRIDDLSDEVFADPDPTALLRAIAATVCRDGERPPTDAEWEHIMRGASGALFVWGDAWPGAGPDPGLVTSTAGLIVDTNSYRCEVTASRFRGGDGGGLACGGAPPEVVAAVQAIACITQGWEDVVVETPARQPRRQAFIAPRHGPAKCRERVRAHQSQ